MKFKIRKNKIKKSGKQLLNRKLKFKKIKFEQSQFQKKSLFNNKNICYILSSFIVFIVIIVIFLILNLRAYSSLNIKIKKYGKDYKVNDTTDENTYFKIIQEFIDINTNGTLIYDNKKFKKIKKPKISIVITIHNGEAFIISATRCVQNQDFHDIEIIFVEDESKDGSVKIIKELMKEDPRIILLENERNRGYLYSMIKGVLNAKGKYVMILDIDDFFSVENVLSTVYKEIEQYNIDFLGFSATQGILDMKTHQYTHESFHNYIETSILYQPEISERVYSKNEKGDITRCHDVIWGYIYKTDFFIQAIKEIDEKFLNIKFNHYGDYFLFFIMAKRAKTLKYIKKLFYVTIQTKKSENPSVKYFIDEKNEVRKIHKCSALLGYIELVYIKSTNNFKLASFILENNLFYTDCTGSDSIKEEANRICKLFLDNQYIENRLKNKINSFLKRINAK